MEHRPIQYQPWEIAFLPSGVPADPFREAIFRVEITNPYGDVRWRDAFWDGGVWRLRWMPLEEGPHHLRVETNLSGLPESLGVVISAAAGPDPGFRHALSTSGPVRVADDGVRFARHDGTPFFLKTEETYSVASRATDAEWTAYCVARARRGFTGASLATDLVRFFASAQEQAPSAPPAFHPDLAYLTLLDRRIATLNAHGLVAIPELFRLVTIDHPQNVHSGTDLDDVVSPEDAVRLGRYLVARWGASDLLWRLALPGGRDEDDDLVALTARIGRDLFGDDPWRSPIAVDLEERELLHPILQTESWIGWVASRSHGHRIESSLRWIWTEFAEQARTEVPRPHVNIDPVVYGEQWEVNDPESARTARALFWASLFAAPPTGAGYTMRAIHDWRRPLPNSLSEPSSAERIPTWVEAIEDPSAAEFGRLDAMLSKPRWSELSPAPELLARQPFPEEPSATIGVLANSDRSIVRVYVPRRLRFEMTGLTGEYAAGWLALRDGGTDVDLPDVDGPGAFEPPDDEDWILALDEI